jgi:hypothetical protein
VNNDGNASLIKNSKSTGKQQSVSDSAKNKSFAQYDLAAAYRSAMSSSERGSGAAAVHSIVSCLNYKGSKPPFLPDLPQAYVERLAKAAGMTPKSVEQQRRDSAEQLKDRCKGFEDAGFSGLAAAAHKKSVDEGFGFLKHRTSSLIDSKDYESALKQLTDWPERYIGVLSVNTPWLVQGVQLQGAVNGINMAESSIAAQLILCRLGADCGATSPEALDQCAMAGACFGETLIERLTTGADAYGIDGARLAKIVDDFVSAFRRGDRSLLKF